MPQSSLRHKSKPTNIIRPKDADPHMDDGSLPPTSFLPPGQVLTPHRHPRPRSSWYSQPSAAYPSGFNNPSNAFAPDTPPPSVPRPTQSHSHLTHIALDAHNRDRDHYAPDDEDYDDNDQPSPSLNMTRQQHTAVSEYISDRSWAGNTTTLVPSELGSISTAPVPAISMPMTPPPAPPTSTSASPPPAPRRFSFSRDAMAGNLRRRSSVISQSIPRHSPVVELSLGLRGRSSSVSSNFEDTTAIATLPYPETPSGHHQHERGSQSQQQQRFLAQPSRIDQLSSSPFHDEDDVADDSQHDQSQSSLSKPSMDDYADRHHDESQRMTNTIKAWFSRSKKDDNKRAATPATRPIPIPVKTVAYGDAASGPAPATTMTATTATPVQLPPSPTPKPNQSKTRAALLTGLSQRYTPKTAPHPHPHPHPHPQARQTQRQPASLPRLLLPTLWYPSPPRLRTNTHRPPPPLPGAKSLPYRTKDPRCCDQGKYLGIGTMKAVSPAGVDMLEGWMVRSFERTGDRGRGVRDVRRWLRGEERGTVEWVGEWLWWRWGCEL